MFKVLFVCMANICRSPIAESTARSIAKSEGLSHLYQFDSAGTLGLFSGQPPDPRAQQIAARHGYTVAGIKARAITRKDFERFDLILAMDRKVLFSLDEVCPPEHRGKLKLYLEQLPDSAIDEVPDPYYGNLDGFEHVLSLCERTTRVLLSKPSSINPSQSGVGATRKFLAHLKRLFSDHKE